MKNETYRSDVIKKFNLQDIMKIAKKKMLEEKVAFCFVCSYESKKCMKCCNKKHCDVMYHSLRRNI